jgi:hypothetical protein
MLRRPLALALPLLLLASCVGHRRLYDPTLVLRGSSGERELGVATEYGIVFLGHATRSGQLEVTALFGDGPSVEPAVVEPIGGGLYTAETEIELPTVGICYDAPRPGTQVLVRGRRGWDVWESEVDVTSHPQVDGILLPMIGALRDAADQIGAGVYLEDDDHRLMLVGLVSGRIVIDSGGRRSEYLTVVGPADLCRLVAHRREPPNQREWVYREDVL